MSQEKAKIPKGWRKLRVGEVMQDGDLFDYIGERNIKAFGQCSIHGGACRIGNVVAARDWPLVIRRVSRPKRKARK